MSQALAEPQLRAPWTKIFTAFKIALDLKKLLLAAAGIVLTWLGCWLLSLAFYLPRDFPKWEQYERLGWTTFKSARESWNLMYELAGDPPALPLAPHSTVDAADVAQSLDEFKLLDKWQKAYRRLAEPIAIKDKTLEARMMVANQKTFKLAPAGADASGLDKLENKEFPLGSLRIAGPTIMIDGIPVKVVDGNLDELIKYREGALAFEQIAADAALVPDQKLAQKALTAFKKYLVDPKIKAGGLLRVCPLSEPRGPNPYLLVTESIKTGSGPVEVKGHLLEWFVHDEVPLLLEPLYKFLMPVRYLFDPRAGWWERLYLVLVMLWILAVWGFFGGAICRIATVQVARNERISLKEAVQFTKDRALAFIAAPMFPLGLIGIFWLILIVFGFVDCIPWFGDVMAGLFWPVVLIIGFIMAIVLVGLVAWPLMIATISTEGSDSFDALSRSYSYLYQAPWQAAWYTFLALVYGAVLVFFIGFMGSLCVYLGKWGVSSTPFLASADPKHDREPSYLFMYAPTSLGWRDLLLNQSQFVREEPALRPDGLPTMRREFTKVYRENMSPMNYLGAGLMVIWIWPLFLLILGFGYSYFWSASTIIYVLLRRHVDDTELDEVYLEDDDLDTGPGPMPMPAPAEPAPASKPGTISLNVVEAPSPPPVEPPPATVPPPEPFNNPPPAGSP